MTTKRPEFKRPRMVKLAIRGRFLLDRGFDLVDGPGGSETAGGVAADAHGVSAGII